MLDSAKSEEERIRIRQRQRLQIMIRQLIEGIRIYPLQEEYKPVQATDEPGVEKIMKSKYLNKVYVEFKVTGNKKLKLINRYDVISLVTHKDYTDKEMEMTDEEIEKEKERGRKINQLVASRLAKRGTK